MFLRRYSGWWRSSRQCSPQACSAPSHVLHIMEIYSGDHVTMSQGLDDKLVAWANTFCSEISQSPMPTVKAMLAAVGLGPMEFEDVHEEEKDVGDDADSIVLTRMSLPVSAVGGGTHCVDFYYRDVESCIREILDSPVVARAGVVIEATPVIDDAGKRLFSSLHTANSFLRFQKKVKLRNQDGSVLFIMLYSDETTKRSGGLLD